MSDDPDNFSPDFVRRMRYPNAFTLVFGWLLVLGRDDVAKMALAMAGLRRPK